MLTPMLFCACCTDGLARVEDNRGAPPPSFLAFENQPLAAFAGVSSGGECSWAERSCPCSAGAILICYPARNKSSFAVVFPAATCQMARGDVEHAGKNSPTIGYTLPNAQRSRNKLPIQSINLSFSKWRILGWHLPSLLKNGLSSNSRSTTILASDCALPRFESV